SDILVNSNTQPIICDLNNDGKTEILVPKKLDDNLKNYSDKLSILNGQNGELISEINIPLMHSINMPYGVCDINNDCVLEIFIVATHTFEVASNFKDRIICYSLEGDIIWI